MSWPRFRLRGADETDAAFLESMFVVAADWHPERMRGTEFWRSDPSMTKYIGDWKRDDEHVLQEGGVRLVSAADAEAGPAHELLQMPMVLSVPALAKAAVSMDTALK